ncbi:MAG: isoprenyl transferase [Syntrophobacterales bacterium]|nr:isoprenyl transferase [Syntrophobacterales bacterium]
MDLTNMPRHVAIIMDGNGRWARKRLMNRVYGHEAGIESVRQVISCCLKWNIPYLTLYAFSKENWARPQSEISALWQLLISFIHKDLPSLIENGVRVIHWGDKEGLPPEVCHAIDEALRETASGKKLHVHVALNYGGRHEITRAARMIGEEILKGNIRPEDVTLDLFASFLFSSGVPDPDLVIRTSGEHRISNFLLWQIAYSEIYVTDVYWPDFREDEFKKAIESYQQRERRFGRTSEQIQQERCVSAL